MEFSIFKALPGSTDIQFLVSSSAIDYTKTKYMHPVKYASQILSLNFRWCKPGEIQLDGECDVCNFGTYTLLWNSTDCKNCPEHATCQAEVISLNAGYWRKDLNSTQIVECPNEDACLGGYTTEGKHPVYWETGYLGVLCNQCVIDGPTKFERIAENECSKCPDPAMNLIRIIGIAMLLVVMMVILIS